MRPLIDHRQHQRRAGAASGAADPVLREGGPEFDKFGTWLAVLGLYDLVFALVSYAVFDFLLED